MKKLLMLALVFGTLSLTACEENEGVDVDVEGDPVEETMQDMDAAADEAMQDMEAAGDSAAAAMDEAVDETGEAVEEMGEDMQGDDHGGQ